tara:strand:+ start:3794 stop:4177 length:384 start_codon:yes stop_codon:yes gene_type:complete
MSLFVSDLSITGITDNGESITFNISPNTTGEELELSIISDNNHSLQYSLSNGSLHLSDLTGLTISSSSDITDIENSLDFGDISEIDPNESHEIEGLSFGGKKSRKLKKRNKNKKKRKTKKNKTKCIY